MIICYNILIILKIVITFNNNLNDIFLIGEDRRVRFCHFVLCLHEVVGNLISFNCFRYFTISNFLNNLQNYKEILMSKQRKTGTVESKVALSNELNIYKQINDYEKENHSTVLSKKKGVVYTPSELAQQMVRILDPKPYERIVDLSVGTAIFPITIIEYMETKYNLDANEIKYYVENYLFLLDIDLNALLFAQDIIKQYLEIKYGLHDVVINIELKNALLDWHNKYDCAIYNPPYQRRSNISNYDLKILQNHYSTCQKGNFDMYYAFMELAPKISDRSICITPNTFLLNNSASTLRNVIMKNISYMRDFKTEKKFKSASVYTTITMLDKNIGDTFEYAGGDEPTITMHRSRLFADKWYLDGPINNIDFNPIKNKNSLKFGDIIDIYTRIQTSSNKLYKVKIKNTSEEYHTIEHEGIKYNIEADICLPLKKINTFLGSKRTKDEAIIFPYNKATNKLINRLEMQDKYPETYRYLLAIKTNLLSRDKGKASKYEEWYAYGRKQGLNEQFKNKKCILVPSTYKIDNFIHESIVSKDRFLHSSGFVVIPKTGNKKLVKSVLNSSDFELYLNQYAKKLSGGYNLITSKQITDYTFVPAGPSNNIIHETISDASPKGKQA